MKKESKGSHFDEYENLMFHPYNILLVLLLFGISALFLALTVAFIYNRIQAGLAPIQLPYIFFASTAILIGSSWMLNRAQRAYKNDDIGRYAKSLRYTLWFTLLFLIFQTIGWYELFLHQNYLGKDNAVSYLYLISILHFAHVIAGIPFLIRFIHSTNQQLKEPVSMLVYFSDPSKRLKLRLLTIYWHFLDGLWIYLLLVFTINFLIR